MKQRLLLIAFVAFTLVACKDDKPTDTQTPTTENNQPELNKVTQIDSVALAKPQLVEVLNRYYADIAAEKIDENQYFAPTVKEFYAMKDQPAAKIGESLRQGFAATDNKKVTIDPNSVEVHQVAEGYEVIFAGTSEHKDVKKKTQVKGDFHNRVVFDRNMKILAYNKYEADRGTDAVSETNFAETALLSMGNVSALNEMIDDDLGAICITRKGVFDHIDTYKDAKLMAANDKEIMSWLKGLKCNNLQVKEIPAFDCDKGFKEKGCFLAPVNGFAEVTERAKAISSIKDGVQKINARQISEFQNVETLVTHSLVITEKGLMLGLGKVNGKWRVLVINTAKYDCSA